MTDDGAGTEWVPVIRDIARASGHELRNALNGLVVNLEVVRAKSSELDEQTRQFLSQAIEQADQTARLAEGAIALLNMVVAALNDAGQMQARLTGPQTISVEAGEAEASRIVRHLAPLSSRSSVTADVSGGAVILSIPDKSGSN
ncbi:MAG TPA: histidine kinase dimerization/phospho-acceptor domain-containing protein [Gemmatimonadaceae bacterium]